MKHVLIISNIPSPYRAAQFRCLRETFLDWRVSVLYTGKTEMDRVWKTEMEEADTYFLNSSVFSVKGGEVGGTATRFVHLPRGLTKKLNELRPDVVIASEYNPSAVQALFWAKAHRIPYVNMTDGTLHSESYIGFAQKLTRRLIVSGADSYLASGSRAADKLLRWGAEEDCIAIAYLTVDTAPFLKLNRQPEDGRLLYVGRISREKGLDLLVRALAQMKRKCVLRVAGNDVGGEQANIEALAEGLGVADRIVWLGYREGEALWEEYRRAAVLAVPSRSDCFGLILVEAACAGLPVAASCYADGAYDVLTSGVNGRISDPEDPAAFAACLDGMLAKPMDAEKQRNATAEKFSFRAGAAGFARAVELAERAVKHG